MKNVYWVIGLAVGVLVCGLLAACGGGGDSGLGVITAHNQAIADVMAQLNG